MAPFIDDGAAVGALFAQVSSMESNAVGQGGVGLGLGNWGAVGCGAAGCGAVRGLNIFGYASSPPFVRRPMFPRPPPPLRCIATFHADLLADVIQEVPMLFLPRMISTSHCKREDRSPRHMVSAFVFDVVQLR